MPDERAARSRLSRFAAGTVRLLAIGYPLALVALVAALRLCGERWWLTTILLYLPPVAFALPLPLLVAALLFTRSRRLLLMQIGALLLLLFPLMGLHLTGPRAATPGATHVRIFTANIGLGGTGIEGVLDHVRAAAPDVVVLEEVAGENVASLRAGLSGYAFWSGGQFVVASRFPIEEPELPRLGRPTGGWRGAHYARCRLITPGGPIRLYAAHPISPHSAFSTMRGDGLRDGLTSGRLFEWSSRQAIEPNTWQRVTQVRALADDAAASPDPVVIAGDTNLPGLSWALANLLGGYQDAFAETGRGFGYSYPAQTRPWMRIDRVLASSRFRVLTAATVPSRIYDHLAVVADLELLPAAP